MMKNYWSKGKTVLGIVFGATIGVMIGILFAPKSGKETRNEINNKAEAMREGINYKTHELKEKVVEKAEKVQDDINEITGELKDKVVETAEKVQEEILIKTDEIKEKVKEKVNAIKSNKDNGLNEEYFEEIVLDSADTPNNQQEVKDDSNSEPVSEQEEVPVKPKRTRKKAVTKEIKESTDNEATNDSKEV